MTELSSLQFGSVQSLSHVWLFATPWAAACQASLSITNFWSLFKLMFIESAMPFNHLSSPFPLLSSFPASGSFLMSQFFASGIRVSASASVLPMNIQDWFPLGWTGWISLVSKGLSRVFSNTTVQKHQFSGAQPSLWSNSHIHTELLKKLIYNFRWRDKVETEWFSVVQWLNSLCYFPQLEWLGTHLKLSS